MFLSNEPIDSDGIYPNNSNDRFNIPYAKRLLLSVDIRPPDVVKVRNRPVKSDIDTDILSGINIIGNNNNDDLCYTLIDKFRVSSDAIMHDGDENYVNNKLSNCFFKIFISQLPVHQLTDNINERFATKQFESNSIHINGGVRTGEVVEIYVSKEYCTTYKLLERFRVNNFFHQYVNGSIINATFMLFINGQKIYSIADNPDERFATKALESDTIEINGGVNQNEVFELYFATVKDKALVDRFRVGDGTAMSNGDTTYTNARLINSSFIINISNQVVHQISDNINERFATKALDSDTITINGGVNQNEPVEIYLI